MFRSLYWPWTNPIVYRRRVGEPTFTCGKLIELRNKQWGASFRPEYLKIARFTEEFEIERYQRSVTDIVNTKPSDISV